MNQVCWPYFDPEFDTLPERINGPSCRVTIDNESLEECTVVKVDSVNQQGLLLEVVQVLTDTNLTISKGYISCDAGWFMDVFQVKDEHGNKVTNQRVLNYIQQTIGSAKETARKATVRASSKLFEPEQHPNEHTAIEMTGTDRPGLFSEISAALADLHCNVVEAHAWSHNARLACVAYISNQPADDSPIDGRRLAAIEGHLTTVLRANTAPHARADYASQQEVKTAGLAAGGEGHMTAVERRLHQLMLSLRDFDEPTSSSSAATCVSSAAMPEGDWRRASVCIEGCDEKGYSIVTVQCVDRPRLMFDTVCTLMDMQYVIFHASVDSREGFALQEYFIRHIDGRALNSEGEKERVAKCLEAAIARRVCEGFKLELCAENRVGLLSDITRVLRENGLAVVRADIATEGEKAVNNFYLRDTSGNDVGMEFIESMKREMGPIDFSIRRESSNPFSRPDSPTEKSRFSIGDMLRNQIERLSHSFVTIK